MKKLQQEILEDLKTELGLTKESDVVILSSKIKNACREVRQKRNYQQSHTDEFISADMAQFYSNIRELALYDFNQVGVEGQISHNEGGTNRSWKDRKECLNGIVAFCGVL